MSDVLYPLAGMKNVRVVPFNRVVLDPFEDGSSSSRLLWGDKEFKHRINLEHAPLTLEEFRSLRGFYTERNGGHDSFWFRDNANRGGNFKVRFAEPVPDMREAMVNLASVELAQVAAVRRLPELGEIITAAGAAPLVWWDANRLRYFLHPVANVSTAYKEESIYDMLGRNPGIWQHGSTPTPGGILAQRQYLAFTGSEWAKTGANLSIAGTNPGVTILVVTKQSTTATSQVIFSVGGTGAADAMGLMLDSANLYRPWIGAATTSASFGNSAADTWRIIAAQFEAGTNNMQLRRDGTGTGVASNARSFTAGPAAIGAEVDGGSPTNPGGAMANSHVAVAMVFSPMLTNVQVDAVHNVYAPHYGIATL